jgi:hypothetical protein
MLFNTSSQYSRTPTYISLLMQGGVIEGGTASPIPQGLQMVRHIANAHLLVPAPQLHYGHLQRST